MLYRSSDAPRDEHDLGWGRLIRGRLEVRGVAGDHYAVLRQPAVEVLARDLCRRLAGASPMDQALSEGSP